MNTDLLAQVSAWATAIAAGTAGALIAWRRHSSTRTEVAKDDVERNVLTLLLRERDEARQQHAEAIAARQQCAASLARMTAEKEGLTREVQVLQDNFASWQRKMARLYPQSREFMDSAVMPFPDNNAP